MQYILIVHKKGLKEARVLAARIGDWLKAAGLAYEILAAGEHIPATPALALVLGGDGAILGVARQLAGAKAPILGINLGRVGFLTAVDAADWLAGLEEGLAGRLPVNKCMILKWRQARDGTTMRSGVAVNDIVAGRGALARLIDFRISVDRIPLGNCRSDGILAGTPLGSTGYAASAGGSILQNNLRLINFVPICPFPGRISPMVFAGDSEIVVAPVNVDSECYLTVDGQEVYGIAPGDEITIAGWADAVWLLGSRSRFMQKIRGRSS